MDQNDDNDNATISYPQADGTIWYITHSRRRTVLSHSCQAIAQVQRFHRQKFKWKLREQGEMLMSFLFLTVLAGSGTYRIESVGMTGHALRCSSSESACAVCAVLILCAADNELSVAPCAGQEAGSKFEWELKPVAGNLE